jgi:glycosyltransferase involved in cell wall biosynthesis
MKAKMKRILYVGHSYHNKTKSTEFLLDYLKTFFEVEIILDESWLGKPFSDFSFVDGSYFAVIFFQVLPPKDILEKIKNDNIIYFPMYDQSGRLGRDFWNNYSDLKIVNFSKTLHKKLLRWGFDSIYIQYFPETKNFVPGNKKEVFFWQRITKINIDIIKKLFGNVSLKIHIHKGIDPNHSFVQPTKEVEGKFQITYSDWFESRDEMLEKIGGLIKQKGIYIAPRELEGIGMSFLEAMAMGKAVIAVDNPTMNEYIEHGKTGYLFNPKKPKKIDLSNVDQVQKNAYEFMQRGRKEWEKNRKRIIGFIKEGQPVDSVKNEMPLVNIITVAYNAKNDLEKTIQSVIKQDYPKINYIIIDGESNDGTQEMVEKYMDKINIYVFEKDEGIYEAMNKGISKVEEGYMNFLNAGDEFMSENVISELFSDVGDAYDIVYGKIIPGKITNEKMENPQKSWKFTKRNLLLHNSAVLCHQAMFIRKEIAPLYDTSYKIKGDLDWYFEIIKRNPKLSYRRSNVVVTNYKGGGMSEKRYVLDIYEVTKLIIKRFGLSSFFEYKYHKLVINRMLRENKVFGTALKLIKSIRGSLYPFHDFLVMFAKKILKIISPTYKRLENSVKPKLNAIDLGVSSIESRLDVIDKIVSKLDNIENSVERIIEKEIPILEKKNSDLERGFSNLSEEEIIEKYLDSLSIKNKYCVDIAASDGITMSNTLFLFKRGWSGIALEFDAKMFSELALLYKEFSSVDLVKTKITPENIVSVLKACLCPKDFAFLNFDIDSYDFFVLDKLLSEFRPSLICAEINEKIPPPISFTVKYDPDHFWKGDHFFGQSISKCFELCKKYDYDIVELHYNNLFLIPKELNTFEALLPEKAYNAGYLNKKDRKEKFPWNSDMESLLTMSKEHRIKFLKEKFKDYEGKYILE